MKVAAPSQRQSRDTQSWRKLTLSLNVMKKKAIKSSGQKSNSIPRRRSKGRRSSKNMRRRSKAATQQLCKALYKITSISMLTHIYLIKTRSRTTKMSFRICLCVSFITTRLTPCWIKPFSHWQRNRCKTLTIWASSLRRVWLNLSRCPSMTWSKIRLKARRGREMMTQSEKLPVIYK